jgi:FkbM family methyltransferase
MPRLTDLRSIASHFELSDPAERSRSTTALMALYFDLLMEIRPTVTVEIGAFDASFSLEMKRRLPEVHAVAFEANPYNFAVCNAGALEASVEYLHMAVADVDGAITFNVIAGQGDQRFPQVKGNDSLLQRNVANVEYEQVTVPATTANRFFSQPRFLDSRFSMWIDVEGAAGKVLQGATEVFDRTQSLLIEVEEMQFWTDQWLCRQVDAFLERHGFVPVARDFEYDYQYNVLYVKQPVMDLPRFDYLMSDYFSKIGAARRTQN